MAAMASTPMRRDVVVDLVLLGGELVFARMVGRRLGRGTARRRIRRDLVLNLIELGVVRLSVGMRLIALLRVVVGGLCVVLRRSMILFGGRRRILAWREGLFVMRLRARRRPIDLRWGACGFRHSRGRVHGIAEWVALPDQASKFSQRVAAA
jgi:hypothetical protein